MQPNIWKYFPFPKIFSPKNILHLENILHSTKCSLTKKGSLVREKLANGLLATSLQESEPRAEKGKDQLPISQT